MRTGYLITAKFHGIERAVSFHLLEEVANSRLADILDARDLSNGNKEFLELLEEFDSGVVSWYNLIEDFSEVHYEIEGVMYE